jgi:hypothetical protein
LQWTTVSHFRQMTTLQCRNSRVRCARTKLTTQTSASQVVDQYLTMQIFHWPCVGYRSSSTENVMKTQSHSSKAVKSIEVNTESTTYEPQLFIIIASLDHQGDYWIPTKKVQVKMLSASASCESKSSGTSLISPAAFP